MAYNRYADKLREDLEYQVEDEDVLIISLRDSDVILAEVEADILLGALMSERDFLANELEDIRELTLTHPRSREIQQHIEKLRRVFFGAEDNEIII